MSPWKSPAQGRLASDAPVAIVDIGSNSVRLVAYEGRTRAPTPIFNEKAFCGLGRGVVTTGALAEDAMDRALSALARFETLCRVMGVKDIQVVATAAARDASNGQKFLDRAEQAIGAPIQLLSGKREAELSALGVVSAMYEPDGVVGDLGGGSLELIDVDGKKLGRGETLPLGGLALMDASGRSPKQATKIARELIADAGALKKLNGRVFYAIGGTWRALARLHMLQRSYPLNVMHNYEIPTRDAADFVELIERVDIDSLNASDAISAQRRPLLAYGAIVLDEIIKRGKPSLIVMSAAGVREGLLYEQLPDEDRSEDPLIAGAAEFNVLRSRAPAHAFELADWIDAFFRSTELGDTLYEARLRRAACLLSDIAWRAHPDYRGVQAFDIVANASFTGVDHAGRAFIALAIAIRHIGLNESVSPAIRGLVTARLLDRARIMGAAMRVAYITSAAMPGVLPRAPLAVQRKELVLTLPAELAPLASERIANRMKALGKIIGREPRIVTA
ncbi:MAG: exopolyphosphatase [Hyphomicrobiales bacterium]|nr:exopolyphosphatase [Hyphomicrobiales bacterium]